MKTTSGAPPAGGFLNDVLGVEWIEVAPGLSRARMRITRGHMAPNGYLHAASVIALADSASGVGCMTSLPAGATGFTTIELKSNFLGTAAIDQTIVCRAWVVHGGRTTQVWDAEVTNESTQKPVALFRCTQLLLYPKA
jgi:1,4-dihydroxy-2-naphthoyl-CoA hydrolase